MRIVSLFDTHIPYNINLKPVFKFIHDFKPHVVVCGGDMHDFTPASHWIANQSILLDGQSIQRCYDELEEVLFHPLVNVIPSGCEIKYLIGNHEDWLRQTIELNRNGQGYWELENNLLIKKRRIELIPINHAYQPCENLLYIHGIFTNEFHAKKTVQAYHNSVIYGHVHDIQVYTNVSPVNIDKFYTAQSVGCLCSLNPHYALNKPNRWVHGFSYVYIDDKTGFFGTTQVVIVQGGFWALGKFYD